MPSGSVGVHMPSGAWEYICQYPNPIPPYNTGENPETQGGTEKYGGACASIYFYPKFHIDQNFGRDPLAFFASCKIKFSLG